MAIKKLLLLSGPMRAGKSSVARELREYRDFTAISTGDYLRASCGSENGLLTRPQLQDFGDLLDRETDYAWVVERVALPATVAAPNLENWLMDAVRKPRQLEHFRAQFGSAVRHVHLIAPESLLKERYASMVQAGDSSYATAIAHSNEVISRSLGQWADCTVNTETLSTRDIADQIISLWDN